MNIDNIEGAALDWAVAKCLGYFAHNNQEKYWESPEGVKHFLSMRNAEGHGVHWTHNSTDWGEGGEIIGREGINLGISEGGLKCAWHGYVTDYDIIPTYYGSTQLIAAMRCYVASKLGDEVEIPEELK